METEGSESEPWNESTKIQKQKARVPKLPHALD